MAELEGALNGAQSILSNRRHDLATAAPGDLGTDSYEDGEEALSALDATVNAISVLCGKLGVLEKQAEEEL